MEKLKDFLYDKNDILIALAVLAVSLLLIAWRMDAIMDYPEKMFEDNQLVVEEQEGEESGESGEADESEEESKDEVKEEEKEEPKEEEKEEPKEPEEEKEPEEPAEKPLWEDGKLTRDVTVGVYGNSATGAIQCLVSAGLLDSYSEYKNICNENGWNHENVGGATYNFKAGSTKKDIVDKVNWHTR